jgi:polysaccharide export outer membrane protein
MKTATFTALSLVALLGSAAAQTTADRPVGTSGTARSTTTAAPASTPAAAVAGDYRLTVGDKLRIDVYKDAQLSQQLQVRPDGKITLPLVGDLVAAGRTPIELRDSIVKSLADYMKDPTVTVIVVETTPPVFYINGEVSKPGVYTINGRLSVIQAIAMAGGFTDFANRKDITIQRGTQRLHFNYKDALDEDNRREPMQLQAGDTIIVK